MNLQAMLQQAYQGAFHLTETVAPALAHRWAVRLFVHPMKHKRPAREVALLQDATVEKYHFNGFYPRPANASYYVKYSWGSGPTVLLVHGWAGRGSQLATLVAPLVNAGYQVVTFDAPAHGDSPGERTNLLEVSDLIRGLSQAYAGFAAIVGHSFGGMAAGHALYEGASAEKLITIGSPVTMASVLEGFGSQLNASPRTVAGVKRAIERLANRDVDTFSLSHTLANSPVSGLIVHDEEDKEVGCDQAQLLHQVWPQSSLYITKGLGHRRILRDKATIARIVDFIAGDMARKARAAVPVAVHSGLPTP